MLRAADARRVCAAVAIGTGVLAAEYVARHVLAPLAPTLAAHRVNDMLASGVTYAGLAAIGVRFGGVRGPSTGLRGLAPAVDHWAGWVGGGVAFLVVAGLTLIDHALWGATTLPSFAVPWREVTVAAGSVWLVPASLYAFNCLLLPWAEELLWRGLVQPKLVSSLGATAGIGLPAALFSAKHAIVDASLGRLLGIAGVGVVLGCVASWTSWRVSAVSHILMNTAATSWALLMTPLMPPCMVPEPALPAELQGGTRRALALIDSRDPVEMANLFTPSFMTDMHDGGIASFYDRVHMSSGHCSWQCTLAVEGPERVTGRLRCDRLPAVMTIQVEPAPPHKVSALFIVSSPLLK